MHAFKVVEFYNQAAEEYLRNDQQGDGYVNGYHAVQPRRYIKARHVCESRSEEKDEPVFEEESFHAKHP